MHMRVILQVLAPGVQHRNEANLCAEMPGIGGKPAQRLGDSAKQDGIDRLLVLEGDRRNLLRHGEHDVEVADRQKVCLPRVKPVAARLTLAFWAMPVAAGIVGDAERVTILALLDMPAEARCPAHLDGAHDPTFDTPEMSVVYMTISFALAAKDVRHLQSRHHGETSSAWRHHLQRQAVERAGRAADQPVGYLRVAGRGGQIVVAEENLDDPNIGPAFQKMGGKAVAKCMHRHPFVDASGSPRRTAGRVQDLDTDRHGLVPARKQPELRSCQFPVRPQDTQQLTREHHGSILAAFAMLDADDTSFTVDVADFETDCLRGAQPCRISCRQCCSCLQAWYRFEKAHDLVAIQYRRQLGWRTGIGDALRYLIMPKGDAKEEPQRADRLVQGRP